MKKVITLLSIILMSGAVSAQDSLGERTKYKHQIGLHAGTITGTGFSYRYWPSKFGVQVTGIPIFGKNINYYNLGLSGLVLLKDSKSIDLFGYVGGKVTSGLSLFGADSNKTTRINTGAGVGINIIMAKVLNLSLQAGYGVYNLSGDMSALPTGEIGLYYKL